MMKKIAIILGTWMFFCFLLAIVQSCDRCDDGPFNYRLVSINGEVKRITGIELLGSYQTANYIVEEYVGQTNGVRYDSIGIDIFNTVELLAYDNEVDFFESAFACSPVTNFELLADMTIISSSDYTDSYPAGTDLKEIMLIREGYQQQGSNISAYLSNAELTEGNLFLTFEFPPSQNRAHDITITYKLFDGREFEVIIQGLKING
jgi:hypothetical protein